MILISLRIRLYIKLQFEYKYFFDLIYLDETQLSQYFSINSFIYKNNFRGIKCGNKVGKLSFIYFLMNAYKHKILVSKKINKKNKQTISKL